MMEKNQNIDQRGGKGTFWSDGYVLYFNRDTQVYAFVKNSVNTHLRKM